MIQRSTDHGASFEPMTFVSSGFRHSGGDSAARVIEPSGRIDVLYQGYHIKNTTTYAMDPGYSCFTASTDFGAHWTAPVQVGGSGGTMSLDEWWIDGDIALVGSNSGPTTADAKTRSRTSSPRSSR